VKKITVLLIQPNPTRHMCRKMWLNPTQPMDGPNPCPSLVSVFLVCTWEHACFASNGVEWQATAAAVSGGTCTRLSGTGDDTRRIRQLVGFVANTQWPHVVEPLLQAVPVLHRLHEILAGKVQKRISATGRAPYIGSLESMYLSTISYTTFSIVFFIYRNMQPVAHDGENEQT